MAALEALGFLVDLKDKLLFLHITGEDDREQVEGVYQETGYAAQVAAFTPEMAGLMARAHLLVSRAGASTLAEIAAVGRAAILVPYPYAANNHQEHNARFLAETGAAEVVLNKDFTGEVLAGKIRQFREDAAAREEMEAGSRRLARPDAAQEIVAGCLELIK
jgi:UDP-N-acetylglucosamine--N-acetylmuramyl-(pentapeptide) pyrophosphoryl-undecaprenol N-acetylglucosamine transferase